MRVIFLSLFLFAASVSHAAKVPVSWTPPTLNTNGSVLTDLAGYRLEWGTCNGSLFGTLQAGINVPASATSAFAYPTGIKRACFRVFAVNSKSVSSDSSNVASKDVLPATGRPI